MKKVQVHIFVLLIGFILSPAIGFSQNWDINLLKEINIDRNKSLDPSFKALSSSTMPLSIAVPAGVITYAILSKEKDAQKKALLITSSLASSAVISLALKYSFRRSRPYQKYPEIENLTTEGTPAFPSAHTAFSFSLATSLSMAYSKWYVIAPAYLWAGSVGYSRMHLGVHYPSDVLAGALIGVGSSYLSYRLNDWMNASFNTRFKKESYSLITPLVEQYDQLTTYKNLRLIP